MNTTATRGSRARVTRRDGRLYDAAVTIDGPWAYLTNAVRLSRHLDGFVSRPAGSLSMSVRDVKSIRWQRAQ